MIRTLMSVLLVMTLLLAGCQQGEYVGKYTRDVVMTVPEGCVIGGSSPCAQVNHTRYYFIMQSCDSSGSCQQYEVEVSKATYDSKP